MKLSDQQNNIAEAPLASLCVIACAGSGKTRTAVHRLAKIRTDMENQRAYVALLSFTNTAVKTFTKCYTEIRNNTVPQGVDRVVIDTLDSFITNNIIRPHAHREMKCKTTPFLISGSESFLNNEKYKYWFEDGGGRKRPVLPQQISNVSFRCIDDKWGFWVRENNNLYAVNNGSEVTQKIARLGAYTHELGKYWVVMTLLNNKRLLRVLVNRYPHIIVDEAQDIDYLHGEILKILSDAGAKIALIGDPHQAIYEFSGADGEFINDYSKSAEQNLPLSKNYRSIPNILSVANSISGRNDDSERNQNNIDFGAYYSVYERNNPQDIVDGFIVKLDALGLEKENSAVLYRGHSGIKKILGLGGDLGQGKTKMFVLASIKRDQERNYHEAFNLVVSSLIELFENLPDDFSKLLISDEGYRPLKQKIWIFIRNPATGLPLASLDGKTKWHALLKQNVMTLLADIVTEYGFKACENIGRLLASTKLPDGPLIQDGDLFKNKGNSIRIDTVHQAKGESLDAVLYMPTDKSHLREMLDGTKTEVGRIGYVALTRAKDYFVLGVQKGWIKDFEDRLKELGFQEQN